jgi:hypothetical protein
MMLKYVLFCLGAGLLQMAYVRQPDGTGLALGTSRGLLYAPELFHNRRFQIVVMVLALASWAAEVLIGFLLIAWWAGLFFWMGGVFIANLVILGSPNPARPFFIGLPLTIGASIARLF